MVSRAAPPFDFIAAIHMDVLRYRKSRQNSPKPNHLPAAIISTAEGLRFDDQKIDVGVLTSGAGSVGSRKNDGFRVALGYCNLRDVANQCFGCRLFRYSLLAVTT